MISMLVGATSGIWTNGMSSGTGQWSTTVYHATNATPTRTIKLQVPYNCTSYSITIPYQSGWVATADTDHHMVVINDDTGAYTEFQGLDLSTSTALGAATGNVYTGNGTNTVCNHVSGLPEIAGLITPKELAAGVINHALRAAVPVTSSAFRSPAVVSDGSHTGGLPMGAHLWLPRTASLSGLSGAALTVAKAMQNYGLYVADTSGSFALYAESTSDGSTYSVSSLSLPSSIVSQLVVLQ